jgi:RNA polymerase sigma-70 factor, ECF subfamily
VTETEQKLIFEQWLSKHKGLLFKIVKAYARTAMDQEDLFQEIIIQVWRSVPSFRHESQVSTWLYRIALNTAIRWGTKERKKNQLSELQDYHFILEESNDGFDERLAWLYDEISKLNEIDRSITLLLLDGFSYREIADMLGITETNTGVKINRIKKQLITKSKKYEHDGV